MASLLAAVAIAAASLSATGPAADGSPFEAVVTERGPLHQLQGWSGATARDGLDLGPTLRPFGVVPWRTGAIPRSEPAAAASAAGGDPGVYSVIPVTDIDGDGRGDLSTYENDPDTAWTLRARRGSDGTIAWSRPKGRSFSAGWVVDLTGDAEQEILWGEVVATSEGEGGVRDGYAYRHTYDQRIWVAGGRDGRDRWTRTISGSTTYGGLGPYGIVLPYTEVRDAIVDMRPMPDATGDGIADVFVALASYWYDGYGYTGALRPTRYTATALVLEGTTGREAARASRTVDGSADPYGVVVSPPVLFPLADVTGDDLAEIGAIDVGWQVPFDEYYQPPPSPEMTLEVLTTTGSELWQASMPRRYVGISTIVTALARPRDVLVSTYEYPYRYGTKVFDGPTGAPLWNADADPGPTSDIDGDGGTEITLMWGQSDGGMTISTVDGRSGTALWGPTRVTATPGQGDTLEYASRCSCPSTDLNGDGVEEIWTWFRGRAPDNTWRAQAVTLDGVTGSLLHDTGWIAAGGSAFLFPVRGDVNANGTDDLLDLRDVTTEPEQLSIDLYEGSTRERLSSDLSPSAPRLGVGTGAFADVAGGPGDDFLIIFVPCDAGRRNCVRRLHAYVDGHQLWMT